FKWNAEAMHVYRGAVAGDIVDLHIGRDRFDARDVAFDHVADVKLAVGVFAERDWIVQRPARIKLRGDVLHAGRGAAAIIKKRVELVRIGRTGHPEKIGEEIRAPERGNLPAAVNVAADDRLADGVRIIVNRIDIVRRRRTAD